VGHQSTLINVPTLDIVERWITRSALDTVEQWILLSASSQILLSVAAIVERFFYCLSVKISLRQLLLSAESILLSVLLGYLSFQD
jgi:hypothetical protein